MSIKLPKLNLNGEIEPCSESAIDKINENFEILDFTSTFSVERVNSLPATGSTGDSVIVDGDPNIYYWTDSWQTYSPSGGEHVFDSTNSESILFDGTSWISTVSAVDTTTASNLGSGEGTFFQKTGDDLEFKSLNSGSGISLSSTSDEITISTIGGGVINNWWPDPLCENASTTPELIIGNGNDPYTEKLSVADDTFFNLNEMYVIGYGAGTGEDTPTSGNNPSESQVEFFLDVQSLSVDAFDPQQRIYFECDLEVPFHLDQTRVMTTIVYYSASNTVIVSEDQDYYLNANFPQRWQKIRQYMNPNVSGLDKIRVIIKKISRLI